jgi:hypothetical protein
MNQLGIILVLFVGSALFFAIFIGFWVSIWWYGAAIWWNQVDIKGHLIWFGIFVLLHFLDVVKLNYLVHYFYMWKLRRAFYYRKVFRDQYTRSDISFYARMAINLIRHK